MISTRYPAMSVAMSMVMFTVTKVATVRAKAKPIQNFRDHARPRYKYLLMTLNSSSNRRASRRQGSWLRACRNAWRRVDNARFFEEPLESGGQPSKKRDPGEQVLLIHDLRPGHGRPGGTLQATSA